MKNNTMKNRRSDELELLCQLRYGGAADVVKRLFPGTIVVETRKVKEGYYDDTTTIIKINPDLPPKKYEEVLAHEILHYLGFDHNKNMRKAGYRSYGPKSDTFGRGFAGLLFSPKPI